MSQTETKTEATTETTTAATSTPTPKHGAPPGGAPFDGGGSPGEVLNNYNPHPSMPLEIGLIVGVILVVTLSVVALFFWRSHRNRILGDEQQPKEDTEARGGGSPTDSEHHVVDYIHHGHPVHERGGAMGGQPPVPPPKDERRRTSEESDVIHNISGLTIERISPRPGDAPRTPPTWPAWGNRNGGYNGAEEHEIVNRV
ncbi:hypothetical protein PG989_015906 [Apiospora arundinis]|uniref:Uncharacterized protein n=1 Tax=Apiospora arundinis TaxID=335852 RepID=A0ABR2JI64_9PEZI